jgi:hypothetical protein
VQSIELIVKVSILRCILLCFNVLSSESSTSTDLRDSASRGAKKAGRVWETFRARGHTDTILFGPNQRVLSSAMLPYTRAVKALSRAVAAVAFERAAVGRSSVASSALATNGFCTAASRPRGFHSSASYVRDSSREVPLAATLASLPLTVEPPGIPKLIPARNLPTPAVKITTLSNGLRVATQETYGQVASMALFIDAGCMYEDEQSVGGCTNAFGK